MAACDTVDVVAICSVCQETLSPPLSQLDLVRPDSCSFHWFHRQCLRQALQYNLACPNCSKKCRWSVDQSGAVDEAQGEQLSSFPNDGEEEDDEQANEEIEEDIIRCLCGNDVLEIRDVIIPCEHRFHPGCLDVAIRRVNRSNPVFYSCPVQFCREKIIAVIRYPENVIVYHDRVLLANSEHEDLQAIVGLPRKQAPCTLCNKVRPTLTRVVPRCCPKSHIVHQTCLERLSGTGPVRLCPVRGCNRQFTSVTVIPGKNAASEEQSSDCQTVVGSCRLCQEEVRRVAGVRPNSCAHLFHRQCLVRRTNHMRECPVRGCKKKFRYMQPT